MKVIFLLVAFISFLLFDTYLVMRYPYTLYQEFLDGSIKKSFLKIPNVQKKFLQLDYQDPFWKGISESETLWTDSHFLNFSITLPRNHPLIRFRPIPRYIDKRTIASFSFTDTKNTNLMIFNPMNRVKLRLNVPSDELFSIPMIENYIYDKNRGQILRDLFLKDLSVDIESMSSPMNILSSFKKVSPLELAYNIYIYKLRTSVLNYDYEELYLFNPSSLLLKVSSDNKNYNDYIILSYHKGYIYSNKISLFRNDNLSNSIISHFSKKFHIKPSRGTETARKVYSKFSILPFKKRLTTQGVALVYSSWTHEQNNPRYLQELIYFLERGDAQKISLLDVYTYTRNRWGSNFSTIKEQRDESVEIENQRMLKKQREAQEKNLINDESALEQRFNSGEDKLNFLLKRAKSGDKKKRNNIIIKD